MMMKIMHNKVKKHLCLLFLAILSPLYLLAEDNVQPFKGHFLDKKENIHLELNLYECCLEIPGMEFVGNVQGYLHGNIYGIWLLTKFEIKDNVATLRFSHDSGADSQTIQLTQVNDSTFAYKAINGNAVRRVHKRKLVKTPSELTFIKKK